MGLLRSRRVRYSAAGLVLAAGAPAGWLLINVWRSEFSLPEAVVAAVSANSDLYVYLTCATAVAFAAFGYLLGAQADQLRRTALTDHLTGLATRQRLFEFLDQELAKALRYRRPLTVVMVDIDHFKSVNDRFGHRAGDEVLRTIARVLVENKRSPDIATRYGGEEFLLVLPETTVEEAVEFADRIRSRIASLRVPWAGADIGVTASLGIAGGVPSDASWKNRLIEAADIALYNAKRAGRDSVRVGESS